MVFKKIGKSSLILSIILGLTACVSAHHGNSISQHYTLNKTQLTPEKIAVSETLYNSTGNYASLVSLYRTVLESTDEKNTHTYNEYLYKLVKAYFDEGDYNSTLLYVKPLLTNPQFRERGLLIQLRTLVQLKQYNEALKVANNIISKYPNNAQVYNSQGIAYAQLGNLQKATQSFNTARTYFLNDTIALNNLAMISILEGNYSNAVRLLLPQYLNGQHDQRLLYNLVFSLVKSGDVSYARKIIERENMNTNSNELINALKNTTRNSNHIMPTTM